MTTLYVDVSHHDWSRHGGQLDWARIRAATSPVMVARATYGDPGGFSPDTRYFASMVAAAKAQGFLCGAYHNLIRGDQASINRQVDWLRREMDGAGAAWAMLDVERYDELLTRGLHPRIDDAQRFCDRWRAVDSRVLTVYLPRWIWDGHMGRPDLRPLNCPLVASNYGSNPDGSPTAVYTARGGDSGPGWNAYGGVTPAVWQYGSNIDCPGASGQTDVNAFRGTLAQLAALVTGQPEGDDMTPEELMRADTVPWDDTKTYTVGGALYDTAGRTAELLRQVAAVRAGQEAILAAVKGLDTRAVLARIDEVAAAEATRDADLPARLLAALPQGSGPVAREDLEAALRSVLGSVDNPPAG